jgi:pyridoxine 5-phosphate synthase
MLKLGVNIDHVATLRQARGTSYPSVLAAATCCEEAGAYGITVHLREDRRHIQDSDVYGLKEMLSIPLNLEMANSQEIVNVALDVKPKEVCIVPEKREELTTEGGLDVVSQLDEISDTVARLSDAGIEVSLFIDPDENQIEASHATGAPFIELHTGTFCDAEGDVAKKELERLIAGAKHANEVGLKVNAGHGISMGNIAAVLDMPHLCVLNIGHSIVARSVFLGMEGAVREMLSAMESYGVIQ